MAKSRVLKRDSVFLTDPSSSQVTRFERGDEIPEQYGDVGAHLFEDEPDYSGTPQTGTFGRVMPFGGPERAAPADAGGGVDDGGDGSPAKSAPKAEWVDHAVAAGADRGEVEQLTKDQLVEKYGQ